MMNRGVTQCRSMKATELRTRRWTVAGAVCGFAVAVLGDYARLVGETGTAWRIVMSLHATALAVAAALTVVAFLFRLTSPVREAFDLGYMAGQRDARRSTPGKVVLLRPVRTDEGDSATR